MEFRKIRCKITNLAFKNRINEFIYLLILSTVMISILSMLSISNLWGLYKYLICLSAILSIFSIRSSNCVVFFALTKDLGMSIQDLSEYHSYDYYDEREKISELFKKECIEGIINLYSKPYARKIKITTHKWVYENILSNEEVLKLYEVNALYCGKIRVPQEVLTLNSKECLIKYKERLNQSAYRERDKYKVILTKK